MIWATFTCHQLINHQCSDFGIQSISSFSEYFFLHDIPFLSQLTHDQVLLSSAFLYSKDQSIDIDFLYNQVPLL